MQLAPLILSSRQYSPKVEMNRQLAAQLHPQEAEQVRACNFMCICSIELVS